jgi:ABC-type glycerol-3-phosphate transport system substrate-binding protein
VPNSILPRRRFLSSLALALIATPIAACGQSAPASPTTAAQPTTATKPTSAPTTAAATKPAGATPAAAATKPAAAATTAATAAAKPASSGQTVPLSIAVRSDAPFAWQTDAAKKFGESNPNVKIEIVQVPYNEMEKKVLAMLATNTLPDTVFSGAKWFRYTAYKGAFLAVDDLVKTDDPGMDDFFKNAVETCQFDGKLYGLPYTMNTGNTNIILYNKDMLAAKGVKEPTDDWTLEEFATAASQLTDKEKKVWGTNLLPSNYYDLATWARTYGGDIMSEDGKQFTLATDPKTVEAARWVTELHTQRNAAPGRADAEGVAFPAGQLALFTGATYSVLSVGATIADKFKWDAVLAPVGPDGLRGYEIFTSMYSVSAKTKHVPEAYALMAAEVSEETGRHSFFDMGTPPARASIWESPEAQKQNPIFGRVVKWLADPKNKGPFPMPYNLRFSELQDKFGNLITPVYYGETGFDEGLKQVQEECQQIVAMPRG